MPKRPHHGVTLLLSAAVTTANHAAMRTTDATSLNSRELCLEMFLEVGRVDKAVVPEKRWDGFMASPPPGALSLQQQSWGGRSRSSSQFQWFMPPLMAFKEQNLQGTVFFA